MSIRELFALRLTKVKMCRPCFWLKTPRQLPRLPEAEVCFESGCDDRTVQAGGAQPQPWPSWN